jgi:amino acid adenylation domain-containing protein
MFRRSVNASVEPLETAAGRPEYSACSATEQTHSQDVLVPQLVSAQAAATPNAPAVKIDGEVLPYGELDGRANRIAHHLRSHGVGPDTLVGICLERSVAQVVGALGVLKAGGAYLPLDPTYPAECLAFMLNDAQIPVLLTKQHFAARLPVGRWRVIDLDADEPQISRCPPNTPDTDVNGKNLAYVIYTSGSTGRPKGVQITHDGLLNLVLWHQQIFGVKPSDRATQLTSPAFDAAVWELWPYLTAGASIFLPSDAVRNEPEALRNWLVAQRITITFVPTPLAERMMTLKWPRETALRIFLTGADTLHRYPPPDLPFTLVNNYGPTECTVVATSGPVSSSGHPDVLPAIGRPICNVQIHILDEQRQQVPVGVVGEIYIGGAGLARGYLNRPELTAERFVPDPFSSDPNARLYKSGDIACYLEDGQIAFLGRIDEQVKIQGFRIEPAEIVRVLDEHPGVQASVVLAREVKPGDKRLVAYFVSAAKVPPTDLELRHFIAARLPEYMVPTLFVKLRTLPLNPNGKVDRAALPEPNWGNSLRDDPFVAPRTAIEGRVVEIVAALLELGQVSVEDNFFLLGGHSLLGTQLIARVRNAFGIELGLRTLFEGPTVAELSAQIEAALRANVEAMSEEEAQRILGTTATVPTEENPK